MAKVIPKHICSPRFTKNTIFIVPCLSSVLIFDMYNTLICLLADDIKVHICFNIISSKTCLELLKLLHQLSKWWNLINPGRVTHSLHYLHTYNWCTLSFNSTFALKIANNISTLDVMLIFSLALCAFTLIFNHPTILILQSLILPPAGEKRQELQETDFTNYRAFKRLQC